MPVDRGNAEPILNRFQRQTGIRVLAVNVKCGKCGHVFLPGSTSARRRSTSRAVVRRCVARRSGHFAQHALQPFQRQPDNVRLAP